MFGFVGDQRLRRRGRRELAVGLVDDHERRRQRARHLDDRGQRLCVPGRVVRRAHDHDVGGRRHDVGDLRRTEHEVVAEREVLDLGVRQAAQARVQQVGRLEHRGAPARSSVGLEQLGEHLVRPVRGPDPVDRVHRGRGELGQQPPHLAVGVAVQREVADRRRELLHERLGQRVRAFVRVQPHGHVELRRVVDLDVAEARPGIGADAHASPASSARASIAFAWPTSPSARAIAEVPGVKRRAASGDIWITELTVT